MMPLNNASAAFEKRYASHLKHQTPGPSDQEGGPLRPRHSHHGRTFWLAD